MAIDLTVVIPSYNGALRFPEVLDKLRMQTGADSLQWEIILVDNHSNDNTAQVFQEYAKTWNSPIPLRYELEAEQGAGFARKRGVAQANGELVAFLDDDNLPSENWVASAYQFAQNYPNAGAFGSQIHGLFESPPAENVKPLLAFLAIVERGDKPLEYTASSNLLPPSAGLVVRKQAWLTSVPEHLVLNGRVRDNWLTSEDLELLSHIRQNGWQIWYNPHMEIEHKIPNSRLQRSYLLSLIKGIGLSRYVTRTLKYQPWQRPLIYPFYMANDLRRIIRIIFQYGTHTQSDIVASCQFQLSINSIISPFYLYRNGYFKDINRESISHRLRNKNNVY
ncbi:hormogonium polysaccharide biosynthesis glycosyltransferase HpsE [Roseofilum casamattae]|uniref:Hormogonium polysaccharide biosynthesis glycosyltransferase HpsE n=1 Tax=Roseofilum casamattae BLCC-M143 TaxID=3022442 RepID=A0ABT7BXU2_9CYAN|nr:hormogonium polysaccharide biosynthesis glycosyltransferase HpsE [Roseofilum casamattae]MDJ1183637.1 hormogonium polysaccharide biosynthesis glycosyltransferase HpsE [Roseofilum casamattae BLCC-M143]